jgi:hypothetical protein
MEFGRNFIDYKGKNRNAEQEIYEHVNEILYLKKHILPKNARLIKDLLKHLYESNIPIIEMEDEEWQI